MEQFYGGLRVGQAAGSGIAIAPGAGALRDWYLSPTGNDAASGSISAPWLTLARVQAELDKCAFGSLSMVRVYAAAGTYTACNFNGSAFAVGGRFVLQGLSTTTLVAGTVIAGSTVSVVNTSDVGLTDYTRKWLRRKSQAGVILDERQISANTATSITPTVSFLSVPLTTDTFEIYEPAVVIDASANVTYTFSDFPGMNGYSNRALLGGLSDPFGGGVYMADIRWLFGGYPCLHLFNTFLFTKTFQLVKSGANDGRVVMNVNSGLASGINYPGSALAIKQFLSTFMAVSDDNVWLGCGIGGDIGMRIEGGNFWGYLGLQYVLFNASYYDTPMPAALVCGGSLDVPVGVSSNALTAYLGLTVVRYPQLPPYNPMRISCAANFSTAVHTVDFAMQGGLSLSYANILQTQASGTVPAVRSDGGFVSLSSTCIGSSANGFGIEARNGGTIQLIGALNITGLAGDSRVDGANIQPKAYYTAAMIANPAAPLGDGSKIYRFN